MQCGHDRPLERFDASDDLGKPGRLRRLAEFADIGAGNEGAALAVQHDGACAGAGRLIQRPDDARANGMGQRVYRWIVDRDNGQTIPER